MSVVLATDRLGSYLEEALTSVQRQTYAPIEVVVVDDGSEDAASISESARVIPGARVIRIRASGASVARNVGARLTIGKYLVFLDDDDRWLEDRLAAQVEALESDEKAVASYCGLQVIDGTGTVLLAADQWQAGGRLGVVRGDGGILLPNLMIRSEDFHAVGGFHSRLRMAEDLDLVLRLAERGDFVFVDRPSAEYRTHAGNSTKKGRELVQSIAAILELHSAEAKERGDAALAAALAERARRNERYAWWRAVGNARERLGRRDLLGAVGEIGWALRFHPRGLGSGVGHRLVRLVRNRRKSGG